MFLLALLALTTWTELMQGGNTALDEGRLADAAEHFQSALRGASAEHERAASLNNLAAVEETRGNFARAERLYKECIEIWSRVESGVLDALAKPLNNLAVLYRRRGEYRKAAELYERSLALRPNSVTVLNNLGRMNLVQRRFAEAEDYFNRALVGNPDDSSTLANVAELNLAMRKLEPARRNASRVVAAEAGKPLEVVARLTLAGAASEEKQWREAETHLKRATDLSASLFGENDPLTICAYAEYAYVARKLNRKAEAAAYEERARLAVTASRDRHTVSFSELLDTYRR